MDLKNLQNKIGFSFENEDFLKEALTHRSYLNEKSDWPFRNNERLEFLGDAVLELSVTDDLFHDFPKKEEGELTVYRAALVNSKMLSRVAREVGLTEEILTSKGEFTEISVGGGETILGDGLEALIGALYLDSGYEVARKFVRLFIMKHLEEVVKNGGKDAKSSVQEIAQDKYSLTPTYKVIDERGLAHQRIFKVGLYFGGELKSTGTGNSKQSAELQAAELLMNKLKSDIF
ncbi:MAG: ribonuclease III [bacterium]|nr:ribonuclease III [bacterium]